MTQSVNTSDVTVTCPTCKNSGKLPPHHAEEFTECPACLRDRAEGKAALQHAARNRVETFDSGDECKIALTSEVDPRELMRMADDGAPAADVVDSWTDEDFPKANTAATAVAPDESRASSRDDAGSQDGASDADEILHGEGASDGSADGLTPHAATRAACDASTVAAGDRGTRSSADVVRAGALSTGASALPPRGAGASKRSGASVPLLPTGGDLVAMPRALYFAPVMVYTGGDLSLLPARPLDASSPSWRKGNRPVVSSDNFSFLSPAKVMRLRANVFAWLRGAEVAS